MIHHNEEDNCPVSCAAIPAYVDAGDRTGILIPVLVTCLAGWLTGTKLAAEEMIGPYMALHGPIRQTNWLVRDLRKIFFTQFVVCCVLLVLRKPTEQ